MRSFRTPLVAVLNAVLEETEKGSGRRWRPRRRWVLTLACGHIDTREVNYVKAGTKRGQNTRETADVVAPPTRIRCDVCKLPDVIFPDTYVNSDYHPVEREAQP